MHFNSPLRRLKLFSTPKGYSVQYTNRQFPPSSCSPCLGALRWRWQRHHSRANPARWAWSSHERGHFASPLKPPPAPDASPGAVPSAWGRACLAALESRGHSLPSAAPAPKPDPKLQTIQPARGLCNSPSLGSSWSWKSCSAYSPHQPMCFSTLGQYHPLLLSLIVTGPGGRSMHSG